MLPKNVINTSFKVLFILFTKCFQARSFARVQSENFQPSTRKEIARRTVSFRRRRSDFSGFYSFTIDDEVADAIAEEVMKSVRNRKNANVFEINPGIGKITKALMEKGLEKLVLCDPLSCLLCRAIVEQSEENIEVLDVNNVTLVIHQPEDIFPSDFDLNSDQYNILIGVNMNRRFVRRLIERVILIDKKYMWNQEFYILMSEDIYNDLCYKYTKLQDYACIHVVFEMETLGIYPRSAVLPPTFIENKNMYFVRLKRRAPKISGKKLANYWAFLRFLAMKKHKCVVAVLEKLIPGCGPFLIANGFSVMTKAYELSRKDLMTLYNVLLKYETFESAMNNICKDDIET